MTTPEVVPADPGALADRLRRHPERRRLVIGICGAPGSGKSRLAGLIADQLNSALPGLAVVVPMDGFHLAASVIAADDRRTRRGAPDTFDPEGYAVLLQRLRENADDITYAPQYRREIADPVAGAIPVPRGCRYILTEGNYLLHPSRAWRAVRESLDEVWFLQAASDELRLQRLIARHEQFGETPNEAFQHATGSDEHNAKLIAEHSEHADLILHEVLSRTIRESSGSTPPRMA